MPLLHNHKTQDRPVADMAEKLVGSEIIKLAGEVKAQIAAGKDIYNLTIGDFNPEIFPIPEALLEEIIAAYRAGETNYPAANGMAELREAVSDLISRKQGLDYDPESFLIAGGARPLIYATYQALVNPGELVLFPVPSWNNNHYTHLKHAKGQFIHATAETNFMPTADDLRPYIQDAAMIALCSPLNPTGTVFSEEQLRDICELVLEENERRGDGKPVYLMYDQIYWQLTHSNTKHYDPVSLYPAMRDYTLYIDGLSKAFAATGVRVGWAFGPQKVINKMKAILGHVGAWAAKAEQMASARYLKQHEAVDSYVAQINADVNERLVGLYEGIEGLKAKGYPVQAIAPQAAIYLTAQFDLVGYTTADGQKLDDTKAVTAYLLHEAGIAVVPFYAFGAKPSSTWYRISVGTTKVSDLAMIIAKLEACLSKLKK